jgi:hypothetical protein
MAKQNYGINDGYRGTVGTVIGYQWRGQWCLRARPRFVRNPKTEEQKMVRTRFGAINKLARALSSAINAGYGYKADNEHTTTRGLFVRENWECVSVRKVDGKLQAEFDYEGLVVSEGAVPGVGFGAPAKAEGKVTVPVTDSMVGVGCALETDEVNVIMYNKSKDVSVTAKAVRTAESVVVEHPGSWTGDEVELYGFVTTTVDEATYVEAYSGNVYPKMASKSSYIGGLTL